MEFRTCTFSSIRKSWYTYDWIAIPDLKSVKRLTMRGLLTTIDAEMIFPEPRQLLQSNLIANLVLVVKITLYIRFSGEKANNVFSTWFQSLSSSAGKTIARFPK
jgi:hypothetical protein